jgi:hypothetical protein
MKCNSRGVRLEVGLENSKSSEWSSGDIRISHGQPKKLADHIDKLHNVELNFTQDGASPVQ